MTAAIRTDSLTKRYGSVVGIEDLTLEVASASSATAGWSSWRTSTSSGPRAVRTVELHFAELVPPDAFAQLPSVIVATGSWSGRSWPTTRTTSRPRANPTWTAPTATVRRTVLLVFAIGFGTSAIASEEDKGTMDLLLTLPISRHSVVLQSVASLAVLVGVLCALVLVLLLATNGPAGLDLSITGLLSATVGSPFHWFLGGSPSETASTPCSSAWPR